MRNINIQKFSVSDSSEAMYSSMLKSGDALMQDDMTFTQKGSGAFAANIFWELLALTLSIAIASYLKFSTLTDEFVRNYSLYINYWVILFCVSLVFGKYEYKTKIGFYSALDRCLKSWLITTLFFISVIYIFETHDIGRKWVVIGFGSFLSIQLIFLAVRYSVRRAVTVSETREANHRMFIKRGLEAEEAEDGTCGEDWIDNVITQTKEESEEFSLTPDVRSLILKYTKQRNQRGAMFFTFSRFNLLPYKDKSLDQIINLSPINRVRYINKFHETVHIKLREGGLYYLCSEDLYQRKARIIKKLPPVIGHVYLLFDFFIHRVTPRLPYLRKLYFWVWKYWSKPLSYSESLGRLYSCGFELVEEKVIENKWWFVMRKASTPQMNTDVTYGPLIRLNRYGKGGKMIQVYKFRTMHPYSEYLQDLVMQRNNLASGGKFSNDFRISAWGKLMRKIWLDEIPMIANLLRGDVKLVGVRPLSKQFLSLYPKDFQEKRMQVKPGLIPPYYADMPKTLEEIVDSENKYINEYLKHRFYADWRYFWKAMYNIVVRQKRSN